MGRHGLGGMGGVGGDRVGEDGGMGWGGGDKDRVVGWGEKPFMTILCFFTNGIQMKGGELIVPSKFELWQYTCLYYIMLKNVFRPADVS